MLNARELGAVVQLEASGVPNTQLLSWAHEQLKAKPQTHMSSLLHQLSHRAQKWRASRVGDKFGHGEQHDKRSIEHAFKDLVSEVKRAELESHEAELKRVLQWIGEQIARLQARALCDQSRHEYLKLEALFPEMRALSDESQERLYCAAPPELIDRINKETQALLEREYNRSRPQDYVIAQRSIWWALFREELGLPALRLHLFDGW